MESSLQTFEISFGSQMEYFIPLSLSHSAAVAASQPQLETNVQSDQNSRLEKEFTARTFAHARLTISILNHLKPTDQEHMT